MTDQPILVLGATGGQGGAVLAALLDRSTPVRALVRDPVAPAARRLRNAGAETVAGSLDDQESLISAMRGVANVFALTTPFEAGIDTELAQGRAIIAAAAEAEVPHLVFSSVAGAYQLTGVPHFESKAVIETELATSGIPHTILGPAYFFDNALGGADRIRAGVLDLPLPSDRPLQQLARADLGAFAADVLVAPALYVGACIELAGDAPTPAQMASALTQATGRLVRHRRVPIDDIGNEDMRAMWQFLNGSGFQVDIADLRTVNPEVSWASFAQWACATFGSQ